MTDALKRCDDLTQRKGESTHIFPSKTSRTSNHLSSSMSTDDRVLSDISSKKVSFLNKRNIHSTLLLLSTFAAVSQRMLWK